MRTKILLVKKVKKARLQTHKQQLFLVYVVKQLLIYLRDKRDEFHSIKNEKSTCIGSKVIYSTRLLLHAKQIDGLRTP